MKAKSIIILALMVVLSIVLNYFSFFGIEIANFKYDSLFGDNLFTSSEVEEPAEPAEESETDAQEATEEDVATEETATEETTEETAEEEAVEETAEEPAEKEEAAEEEAPAEETAKAVDNGRIRKGIDLAGGSVISFEADTTKAVTEEDIEKAVESSRDREFEMLISSLADDELLVLKTAAELFSDETSPTTKEIMEALPDNCPKLTRVSEIFKRLDRLRLIDLEYSNQGGGRRRYVHIHEDKAMLLKIISQSE